MSVGLGVLHLPPDVFWGMTPVEFVAALDGAGHPFGAGVGPTRRTLGELMARFPDGAKERCDAGK